MSDPIPDAIQGAVRLERIEHSIALLAQSTGTGIQHLTELFRAMQDAQARQSGRLDAINAAQMQAASHPNELTRLSNELRAFTEEHKQWRRDHETDNNEVAGQLVAYKAETAGTIRGLKWGLGITLSLLTVIAGLCVTTYRDHIRDSREDRARVERDIQTLNGRINRLDGQGNIGAAR